MHRYYLFSFYVLIFFSCNDYETQFEGPYSDETNSASLNLSKSLIYVSGNKVYLADELLLDIEEVQVADNSEAFASIDYDHEKVLIKNIGQNIIIWDYILQEVIDEIPESSDASWFDFHTNNETVYFLKGNELHTYGPEIYPTTPINLATIIGGNPGQVTGITIDEDGIIYIGYDHLSNNTKRLYKIEDGEVDQSQFLEINLKDFRMAKNGDVILASQTNENVIARIWPSNLSVTYFDGYTYGAPVGGDIYYLVTQTNSIEPPFTADRLIESGTVTSIDY